MDGADEEEEEHQRLHFGNLSNTTSSLGGLCATELTAGDHQIFGFMSITLFVKTIVRYLFR